MKNIFFFMGILCLSFYQASSQGCVAIRSTGSCATTQMVSHDLSKWQFNAGYRYFKSFRHFKGKEEQKERLEQDTDVRNYQHSLDLSLSRHLNKRWSLSLNVPILANRRSSLYEHGLVNGQYVKRERRFSESFGLGDMRLTGYYWIMDPAKAVKGNIQIGMGVKFATGDYNFTDYFYNVGPNGDKELRTVDQSIQLGDGGTGIALELNAYRAVVRNLSWYGNIYYLSNPREVNGTRTWRETLSPALFNEDIMSVPDQYMFRTGLGYTTGYFNFSAGGRVDGIPVYDVLGGSDGFRRPGYVVSVEPGASYTRGKNNFFITVPVMVTRNRTQSVTDKEATEITGTYRQGDAAFADYVINVGYSVRF